MRASVGGIMLIMLEIGLLEQFMHYLNLRICYLVRSNSLFITLFLKSYIEYGLVAFGNSADQGIKEFVHFKTFSLVHTNHI